MAKCNRCLYDETIPNLTLDDAGVCGFCHVHERLERQYPTGPEGTERLLRMADRIKRAGRGKRYDVVVGVSGGGDSSYLLYVTKRLGLRPVAVHFDNSWNTETAWANLRNVTDVLGVDLDIRSADPVTYNDVCRSFLRAGVVDADIPNDIALMTTLYRAAEEFGVKSIFIGHSFRTEGIAPTQWTYMDGKYIESVHARYGALLPLEFPNLWLADFLRWAMMGIKRIRPLYYLDYNKKVATAFLAHNLKWKGYGGHHLENKYTKFILICYLPQKFGIDKRILGYSALVRSGQMKRERGLELLRRPPECDPMLAEEVRDRLSLSDFERIMTGPRRTCADFQTYKRFFERTRWFWWAMQKLDRVPRSFYLKYARVGMT